MLVKIAKYLGFCLYRRSVTRYLTWSPVTARRSVHTVRVLGVCMWCSMLGSWMLEFFVVVVVDVADV